jgi:hypothetical protein
MIRADWGHACPPEKKSATTRATMATSRIYKAIMELGYFDWDYAAQVIDEAIADAIRSHNSSVPSRGTNE